jgi:hypothetical protein
MSNSRVLAAVKRTKQFQSLIDAGLQLVSTERQLQNGTLAFTGKIKKGRKTFKPSYKVTVNGAVLSNEFVARRVTETGISGYRQGLEAIREIFEKRLTA